MQMEDKRTYLQEIYPLAEKHLAQMAEDELARFCDGLWRYYQANDPDDPRYIRPFEDSHLLRGNALDQGGKLASPGGGQ